MPISTSRAQSYTPKRHASGMGTSSGLPASFFLYHRLARAIGHRLPCLTLLSAPPSIDATRRRAIDFSAANSFSPELADAESRENKYARRLLAAVSPRHDDTRDSHAEYAHDEMRCTSLLLRVTLMPQPARRLGAVTIANITRRHLTTAASMPIFEYQYQLTHAQDFAALMTPPTFFFF